MAATHLTVTVQTRGRHTWIRHLGWLGYFMTGSAHRRFASWLWRHMRYEYRVGDGEWQRIPNPPLSWEEETV